MELAGKAWRDEHVEKVHCSCGVRILICTALAKKNMAKGSVLRTMYWVHSDRDKHEQGLVKSRV